MKLDLIGIRLNSHQKQSWPYIFMVSDNCDAALLSKLNISFVTITLFWIPII